MKSFQPNTVASPLYDDGPVDDPSTLVTMPENAPSGNPLRLTNAPHSHRHCNARVDFKGEKCSNATHVSITDRERTSQQEIPWHWCHDVLPRVSAGRKLALSRY